MPDQSQPDRTRPPHPRPGAADDAPGCPPEDAFVEHPDLDLAGLWPSVRLL